MISTKEQELKALETIREILDSLGGDSHVAAAFEGCAEIAKENIDFDFATSMKELYEKSAAKADALKKHNAEQEKEIDKLKNKLHILQQELDRELEWKPYIDGRNVSQETYDELVSDPLTHFPSDEEATEIICTDFGFAREKIRIVRTVNTYEIDRHHRLRKSGETQRRPAYNATDWNYILFECSGVKYEICDGNISIFIG